MEADRGLTKERIERISRMLARLEAIDRRLDELDECLWKDMDVKVFTECRSEYSALLKERADLEHRAKVMYNMTLDREEDGIDVCNINIEP